MNGKIWGERSVRIDRGDEVRWGAYRDEMLAILWNEMACESARPGVESACEPGQQRKRDNKSANRSGTSVASENIPKIIALGFPSDMVGENPQLLCEFPFVRKRLRIRRI